jgi:hypothetical protein
MGTVLVQAQSSLAPYIKTRKEASHIRQILAAHLDSHLSHATGQTHLPALSLVHDSTSVKNTSGIVPGLRKEYLKALRANIKARREYDQVCNTNTLRNGNLTSRDAASGSSYPTASPSDKSDQLGSYLALIKQRQRHERLRILQDYFDKLEQKSATATSFLDESNPQLSGLPQVPVSIVASSASGTQEPNHNALKDLIKTLEHAVLRAKVQLRNEKQLLEQVKASSFGERTDSSPVQRDVQTLQALGRTRNELILWVEEELGKAGQSEPQNYPEPHQQSLKDRNESIEDGIVMVKAQYGRYVQARRTFIDTIAETVEPISTIKPITQKEDDTEDNEAESTPSTTWIVSPYLRDLQNTSNEQKSAIQQKSYLTVSLAKQHKETVQLFDRLAHESHLLPAYPVKVTGRNIGNFDLDDMAGKEMPSAAHRARAWTYAGESAGTATNKFVLAHTEDGETSTKNARDMLLKLEQLLGHESGQAESLTEDDIWTSETSSRAKTKIQGDIWSILDGSLGVLQRGEDKRFS